MARLEGSFPLKFNDKVIGRAYIIGQDSTSITLDIAFDDVALLNSITELVSHGQLPAMSFGFITDLLEPKGLMQVIPPTPIHWEKLKTDTADLTHEAQAETVRRYMQARFEKRD